MPLRSAFTKALDGTNLTADEAAAALNDLVDGDASPLLLAGLLVALRMKGETSEEIAGFARTMLAHAVAVTPKTTGLVDVVGTGGDGKGTFNISTMTSFVVAGAGLPVAKHGNRALSSKCGSADVLETLGVPLDLSAADTARCVDEAGIGFLFAPALHPAMAKVMPVRRELAVRTAFNILGPLTNPARPAFQLVGVGVESLAKLVAGALAQLGVERALVVHGAGGTDELTCAGENLVLRVEGGTVTEQSLTPADAGLEASPLESILGGTPDENAECLRDVLGGQSGPVRECVLFNAGAAFVAAGVSQTVRDGADKAREVIDSGAAAKALDRLLAVANS